MQAVDASLPEARVWTPPPAGSRTDRDLETETLEIDASVAFLHPIVVTTTAKEVCDLVARLRNEPKAQVIALSNKTFRTCVEAPSGIVDGCEAFDQLCGAILLFYATRHVLVDSGFPLRQARS